MSIAFSADQFAFAHGKSPCGRGSWTFCPRTKYNRDNYLDFCYFFNGSYADAKKAARVHFTALAKTDEGNAECFSDIVVCS